MSTTTNKPPLLIRSKKYIILTQDQHIDYNMSISSYSQCLFMSFDLLLSKWTRVCTIWPFGS